MRLLFRAQGMYLVAANVISYLSLNEIVKIKASVVISECTVCYRVVTY